MADEEAVEKTIKELEEMMERDLPREEKSVLKGVKESLEEFLEIPFEEDDSPFQEKDNYSKVYKRKLDR